MSAARWCACALVAACVLVTCGIAAAETIDQVVNPRITHGTWVSDMAEILGPAAEDSLNAISNQLQESNGAELAVVTVRETGGMTPKQFATALFGRWGIGQKDRDNGVLVLVVVNPHRVEVEPGYGVEALLPDGRVGHILDQYVIPHFREGDWDGGVVAGSREIARVLSGGVPREAPSEAPASEQTLAGNAASGTPARAPFPFVPIGTGLVALAGLAAWRWGATSIRWCERCRRRMRLLTREQEGAYLSVDQNLEEELRSVNHVVWRCDDCQVCRIEHRVNIFSRYRECPQCGNRTLSVNSRTLVEPTTVSSGSAEVTETCKSKACGWTKTRREVLPQVVESSSSSSSGSWSSGGGGSSGGGSFGGGSSGGGGAGRSW